MRCGKEFATGGLTPRWLQRFGKTGRDGSLEFAAKGAMEHGLEEGVKG
jgi:hypothetical protein